MCRNSLRTDAETHVIPHLLILISWGARRGVQKIERKKCFVCVCAEDMKNKENISTVVSCKLAADEAQGSSTYLMLIKQVG